MKAQQNRDRGRLRASWKGIGLIASLLAGLAVGGVVKGLTPVDTSNAAADGLPALQLAGIGPMWGGPGQQAQAAGQSSNPVDVELLKALIPEVLRAESLGMGVSLLGDTALLRSPANAAAHLDLACGLGASRGCLELAHLYLTGDGVARSARQAADYFDTACEAGVAEACAQLGHLHREGRLAESNETDAVRFFNRACLAGDDQACTELAQLGGRATTVQ